MALGKSLAGLVARLAAREADTGLAGLQSFQPVDYLDLVTRRYGGGSPSGLYVMAPQRQIEEVGKWYADAPMLDPQAEASYRVMREETKRQFDDLTRPVSRGGLGVDVNVTPYDPYDVSTPEGVRALVDDLNNRRFSVLSTRATGGHPFLTNDENDMFRAVHDAYGHGATGRGFNRHGEEAAYRSHSRMYSPEARPALGSELRAQNAYVNLYGDFGPQKMVGLPDTMSGIGSYPLSPEERNMLLMDALERLGY